MWAAPALSPTPDPSRRVLVSALCACAGLALASSPLSRQVLWDAFLTSTCDERVSDFDQCTTPCLACFARVLTQGVADVDQLSGQQLISRKLAIVLRNVNPDRCLQAIGALAQAFAGVVATLKLQFARTVITKTLKDEDVRCKPGQPQPLIPTLPT